MTDNTVSVDADLYVLLALESETLWKKLSPCWNENIRSSFAFREQEVVKRKPQELPATMLDWKYMQISIDPEFVAARAACSTIQVDGLRHMPDTLDWKPLRVVSDRFRVFLEQIFPEGSQFFPFNCVDAVTGEQKSSDFWYWLPCHYLRFRSKVARGKDQMMRPQSWGALGGQDVTWEMHNNKSFQSFAADLPFWTPSPTFGEVVFRSDVYRSIKAAGFSGFEEAAADNYLRQKSEDCVGYIQFSK